MASVNSSGSSTSTWQPDSVECSMDAMIDNYVNHTNTSPNNRVNSNSNSNMGGDISKLIMLKNKKPKWDSAHGGHVLNFQVGGVYIVYMLCYAIYSILYIY